MFYVKLKKNLFDDVVTLISHTYENTDEFRGSPKDEIGYFLVAPVQTLASNDAPSTDLQHSYPVVNGPFLILHNSALYGVESKVANSRANL